MAEAPTSFSCSGCLAEMGSINLHAISLSLPLVSHSQAPRSPFRVNLPKQFLPSFCSPSESLQRCKHIPATFCLDESINRSLDSSESSLNEEVRCYVGKSAEAAVDRITLVPNDNLSLHSGALIVLATVASKILGFLREIILAAVFGVGPVATAFKYAWVLPGLFSSLLGGVNGPVHVTMATTLSKLSAERRRKLFQSTNVMMFLVVGVVTALVFIFAEFVVHIYAPGLWILPEGQLIRQTTITQLKLLIPCIFFSVPVGLGFGYMSAEGNNVTPPLSPALSSVSIIVSSFIYVLMKRSTHLFPGDGPSGGILICYGASFGIFLQWIIQLIMLKETRSNFLPFSLINTLKDKDFQEFFSLMVPATMSSGFAHIASITDLHFASFIPGGAASLSYAYYLAMAPSGLLSSMVILPLLPTFSRLAKTLSWLSLMENLKRAVLLCMVVVLPISSTMCMLAKPIICVLFQRRAFDSSACSLVSSLLLCYSIGLPFYIIKELLVAVFCTLGDGRHPFFVSVAAIALNAILNWLFVSKFDLGAQGLALSTSFISALSALILFHILLKKVTGVLDHKALVCLILLLFSCCTVSGFTGSIIYEMMRSLLASVLIDRYHVIQELLSISFAGSVGMIAFFFPLLLLHLLGLKLVRNIYRTLISRTITHV